MFPNSTVNPSKILITVQKRLVTLGNFNKKKIETVHTACLFHSELTKFSETFHKGKIFRIMVIFLKFSYFKTKISLLEE